MLKLVQFSAEVSGLVIVPAPRADKLIDETWRKR